MAQANDIIQSIIRKFPSHAWLQMNLAELDAEIADMQADRNRLIKELSRARNEIHRLRAGLE